LTINNMNFQEQQWANEFGNEYIERNFLDSSQTEEYFEKTFGIGRKALNEKFLGPLPKNIKILEVGANIGIQLQILQEMGFKNLFGIDINRKSIETAKKIRKNIDIIEGSALDIPFKDNYFDLVFTSGVLIHISPENIQKVMSEIVRCSKKYIWGFEYFAESYTSINYRGNENLLWKGNFAKMYQENFPSLALVKEEKLRYLVSENIDTMFLLKKV